MSVEERAAEVPREVFTERCVGFLRDALGGDRWTVWVAEVDGRIVAHVYVQMVSRVPRPWAQRERWGYVTSVFTRAAYRDHGVGGALLGRVVEWARAEGLELLLVWPSERSVACYRRAGFGATEALERGFDDT